MSDLCFEKHCIQKGLSFCERTCPCQPISLSLLQVSAGQLHQGKLAPPLSQGINLYESKPNTVGFLLPGTVLGIALLQFWPIRQEGKSAKKLSLSPKMKRDRIIPFPVFPNRLYGLIPLPTAAIL
uniref:Uncharacterized protein n=1 Tax=Pipistrellus kuhlii TaxID=59472 RepID=A0A7J7XAS8_PIPKU|nr:hypothetical protein mPipKuh1_010602 [Pipistrellus kuhlii]